MTENVYNVCVTPFSLPVPIVNAHEVDVQPSIVVDSRTNLEITWDPTNVFPSVEDPNSFMVNMYIYMYNYEKNTWETNTKRINRQNSGHAMLRMGALEKVVKATCIHVTVGRVNDTSVDDDGKLIESLHSTKSIPFPSRVGIWSGLFFSVFNSRTATDKRAKTIRRDLFNRRCSGWRSRMKETIPDDVIKSLPPCPPTLDRAQLPNSGLEEESFESSLYSTSYHSQWMSTFHPGASICYEQATVTRLALLQKQLSEAKIRLQVSIYQYTHMIIVSD